MSDFVSIFSTLRDAIVARLKSTAVLAGKELEVLSRKKADIDSEIEAQLTSVGVTIFVSSVQMRGIFPDLPNVGSDGAEFSVSIFDSPTTNTTGIDGDGFREICMRRIHQWDPGITGVGVITLVPDPETDRSTKKKVIYDLLFTVSITLEPGLE